MSLPLAACLFSCTGFPLSYSPTKRWMFKAPRRWCGLLLQAACPFPVRYDSSRDGSRTGKGVRGGILPRTGVAARSLWRGIQGGAEDSSDIDSGALALLLRVTLGRSGVGKMLRDVIPLVGHAAGRGRGWGDTVGVCARWGCGLCSRAIRSAWVARILLGCRAARGSVACPPPFRVRGGRSVEPAAGSHYDGADGTREMGVAANRDESLERALRWREHRARLYRERGVVGVRQRRTDARTQGGRRGASPRPCARATGSGPKRGGHAWLGRVMRGVEGELRNTWSGKWQEGDAPRGVRGAHSVRGFWSSNVRVLTLAGVLVVAAKSQANTRLLYAVFALRLMRNSMPLLLYLSCLIAHAIRASRYTLNAQCGASCSACCLSRGRDDEFPTCMCGRCASCARGSTGRRAGAGAPSCVPGRRKEGHLTWIMPARGIDVHGVPSKTWWVSCEHGAQSVDNSAARKLRFGKRPAGGVGVGPEGISLSGGDTIAYRFSKLLRRKYARTASPCWSDDVKRSVGQISMLSSAIFNSSCNQMLRGIHRAGRRTVYGIRPYIDGQLTEPAKVGAQDAKVEVRHTKVHTSTFHGALADYIKIAGHPVTGHWLLPRTAVYGLLGTGLYGMPAAPFPSRQETAVDPLRNYAQQPFISLISTSLI
ncbi:hypothetical protein C8R47DRAFT_1199532 [Mycena vitilis]|nr:hypothetical protein C8R47DRAFT_1199532 [Mycena vitilis]